MKQTFVFDPWKLSETVINLEELHRTITGRIYSQLERVILSETVINWEKLHRTITGRIYSLTGEGHIVGDSDKLGGTSQNDYR